MREAWTKYKILNQLILLFVENLTDFYKHILFFLDKIYIFHF